MANRSIEYIYTILDRYTPALNAMSVAGQKFDTGITRIQAGLGRMQDKLQTAGAKLANLQTGLASIGAGAFLKDALEESMDFQRSLNLTQAVTGSTAEQMDTMREAALEWGAQTQFSSIQVAAAMSELGKMGNATDDILALMPGTMALAAAGEIEMADAANYTMGILNQFGMSLDQAGTVADILASGASGAATSVSGIAQAMNNAGLQSLMAGLSIEDTTAALMAMASKNIEGAEAGTLFKNAMKALLVMTDKTRGGFDDMGINIDNFRDATTGQITNFWGLIEAMKATGETGGRIMAETFDIRALQAFSAITSTTSEQLDEFRGVVEESAGASGEMAETLLTGLGPMVQFQSLIQNMKVMVGTFVSEALLPLLTKFNEWFGDMQKNNPELLKTITFLLMGITVLGAVLVPLGLIISSLGSLIGVIKVVMGVTKLFTIAQTFLSGAFGLTAATTSNSTVATMAYLAGAKLAAAATKVWSGIQIAFNAIMAGNPIALVIIGIVALIAIIIVVVKHWDTLKAAGGAALDWISEKIQGVVGWFSMLGDKIAATFGKVKDFFGGVGGKIADFFTGGSEDFEATSQYSARSPEAEIPYSQNYSANANASVSVYTEQGLGVVPFSSQGNLGYNMTGSYQQAGS